MCICLLFISQSTTNESLPASSDESDDENEEMAPSVENSQNAAQEPDVNAEIEERVENLETNMEELKAALEVKHDTDPTTSYKALVLGNNKQRIGTRPGLTDLSENIVNRSIEHGGINQLQILSQIFF